MDRQRFLIIAAAASSATLAPAPIFAATHRVASVRIVRWPREVLVGEPGRCAGTRRTNAFTLERMLSTR
jgi:hypothetical protein